MNYENLSKAFCHLYAVIGCRQRGRVSRSTGYNDNDRALKRCDGQVAVQ